MKYKTSGNDLILTGVKCFDVALCADCGQAFRWRKKEDGAWHGVVKGKAVDIIQGENEIVFKNTSEEDFKSLWSVYFDLERDYEKICRGFDDVNLMEACRRYYGIRILKQDEWEALCSFIISQNNNIPRIKGIIDRLCRAFGEKIGEDDFSFPSYERIAELSESDLAPLRAGFRGKYIKDAAEKLAGGEISIKQTAQMPLEQARAELMKIKGVGAKVAECTLLYGFGRTQAFPVDVWVKRIMAELYPAGLPECTRGYEGIAQQYLFHWRRKLSQQSK